MPGRPTNEPSNYFALGKQSAAKTEATTFHFMRHLDGTALELDEEIESVREGGDGQEVGLRYKTAISMDGQAVANDRAEIGARMFAWTLGGTAATTPQGLGTVASGIANEHIAVPTSALPYLTVEQFWGDEVERVSDVQSDGLTVEGESGRPLKLTMSLVGGGTPYRRDAASVLTAVRETSEPFFFPQASVVIDGAGNTKITKFKIDVKRNVDKDIRTTELFREDVIGLTFDVDMEFTLKYEDKALYDKVHYGSGSQVPVALATGSFRIFRTSGAGTTLRYQEIGVNNMQYTGARVNKLDPDGKTMYIDVTAMGIRSATHQIYSKTLAASSAAL